VLNGVELNKTKASHPQTNGSRHVVEELSETANFVWLKDGIIQEQGNHINKLPLLLDLGALDSFDRLRSGQTSLLVLTEDRDKSYLEFLLGQNGFQMEEVLIYRYKTSSNLEGATLFVDFLSSVAPSCKVMIHRDRDFMNATEVDKVKRGIESSGAIPFITEGSDIESYFLLDAHLAQLLEVAPDDVAAWKNQLATDNHVSLQLQFTRKRDEIKNKMYRNNSGECPETLGLLGTAVPLPEHNRKGKFRASKINGGMHARFGKVVNLRSSSPALVSNSLQDIMQQVWSTTSGA